MRLSIEVESGNAAWDEFAPGICGRFGMGCKAPPHLLPAGYMIK